MARITLRQLLDHAAEHGYGVPAIQYQQYGAGSRDHGCGGGVDAPVIIQASAGRALSYCYDIMLAKMIEALEEMHPQSRSACIRTTATRIDAATALQHGFTSVMRTAR